MMLNRKENRYVSCPACGKVLFRGNGQCTVELTCTRCNKEIVALLDNDRVMVLENRRGSGEDAKAGPVRVSVHKPKSKKMEPVKQAANY